EVVAAAGDGVADVVAGLDAASAEGRRLLGACWRRSAPRAAEVVVAALSGDPTRHTFADLAAAAHNACAVVRPGGRVVLLSAAAPDLGAGGEVLRQAEGPEDAAARLRRLPRPAPAGPGRAVAASQAHLCLLSGLGDGGCEEIGATPLRNVGEAQRLLDTGGSCLVLADAHKVHAMVEGAQA